MASSAPEVTTLRPEAPSNPRPRQGVQFAAGSESAPEAGPSSGMGGRRGLAGYADTITRATAQAAKSLVKGVKKALPFTATGTAVTTAGGVNSVEEDMERRGVTGELTRFGFWQKYWTQSAWEQIRVVSPVVMFLVIFQSLVLRQGISQPAVLGFGFFMVLAGLTLFLEGVKLGFIPFGETIGSLVPVKLKLPVTLTLTLILGLLATLSEPAIAALQTAGSLLEVSRAPVLYAMLNQDSILLVIAVGIGVGFASVVGTLRFIYNWSLKPVIYITLIPTTIMTIVAVLAGVEEVVGLAWDCGAVTTGPVTVPVVLSLGIGVASASGMQDNPLSGFGIVTLASLFPIPSVISLSLIELATKQKETIIAEAVAAKANVAAKAWYEVSGISEVVGGIRSTVPLILFLLFVQRFMLKEPMPVSIAIEKDNRRRPLKVLWGLALATGGLVVFNFGLNYGLTLLGSQVGGLVPASFAQLDDVPSSPIYGYGLGMLIAVFFAFMLGLGATLAEPALNALGITVERLSNGQFKKKMLIGAVCLGVAGGIVMGILKIIYAIRLIYILVPSYTLAVVLTYFSSEEYVAIGWDSAGVTTGPVTVPLVLAMGLGLGRAVKAQEGFGILTCASVGPILSVLITGLIVKYRKKGAAEPAAAVEAGTGRPTTPTPAAGYESDPGDFLPSTSSSKGKAAAEVDLDDMYGAGPGPDDVPGNKRLV